MAFKRSGLALILFGVVAMPAWCQSQDAYRPVIFNNTDGITTSFVPAPTFTASLSPVQTSPWLKVELHYSVSPKATINGGKFLSNVTFKVWIEGRDLYDPQGKPGEGIAVCLTGTVTYVNVPAGQNAYASFYVHPDTLTRYSTANGYTDFSRTFNIHAEADVDGQISDYFDKNQEQDANWFTKPNAVGGLVYRQDQCAFIVDSSGRYPGIQPEGGSAAPPAPAPPAPPAPAPTTAPSP